jgi:hypothetical protein
MRRNALAVCLLFLTSVASLRADDARLPIKLSDEKSIAPNAVRDGRRIQRQPACAYGDGVYLVAWSDGTRQADNPTADIYCARIEAKTGKVLDPAGICVCNAADLQEWPSVAWDGRHFLVVWQDFRNGNDFDIYAARVTGAGKIVDPDGVPVIAKAANQARPAVAFAGEHFVVAWMDARQYPTYGLYAARLSRDAEVLDPDGRVINAEDEERVAKVAPQKKNWLGDQHYWWQGLQSRFAPSMIARGDTCLITYLQDTHGNDTRPFALVVQSADLAVTSGPARLSGEARHRIAACATDNAWLICFDHWVAGWSPSPRLAALSVSDKLEPKNEIRRPNEEQNADATLAAAPLLDIQAALAPEAESYQQGKGHFAFWQAGCATLSAKLAVAVMDYGWRDPKDRRKLTHVIVAAPLDLSTGRFMPASPIVLAEASGGQRTVQNPVIVGGPPGEALVAFESDEAVDRCLIHLRLIRQ